MSQQPFNFKRGTIDELVSYCDKTAIQQDAVNFLLPNNLNFALLGDYVLLTENISIHSHTHSHNKYVQLCTTFNNQSQHEFDAGMRSTARHTKYGNHIKFDRMPLFDGNCILTKETKKLMLNEDKSKVYRNFSTFNAFLRLISRHEFDLLLSKIHEMLSEHRFKIPLAELDGFVKGCVFFDGYVNIKLHQDNLKEQIKLVLTNDKYTFTNKVQHARIRENLA